MSSKFGINSKKEKMKEAQRKKDFKQTCKVVTTFVVMTVVFVVSVVASVTEDVKKENASEYLWYKYNESFQIESKLSGKEKRELDENINYAYHVVSKDDEADSFVVGIKGDEYFDTYQNEEK